MLRFLSSLHIRLISLVLLAFIPSFVLTLYTASEDRRREIIGVHENTQRLARLIAFGEQQLVDGTRQLMAALAELPEVRDDDPILCSKLLSDLLKHYRRYSNFGVIQPNGYVFCSALPTPGPVNVAESSYFRVALETKEFAIGDYQVCPITGNHVINFGYPVLDEAGRAQAVVFASLDLDWLSCLEFEVERQLPPGTTFSKIDPDGVLIARSPDQEKWIGRPAPETFLLETVLRQGVGVTEASGPDGVTRIYAYVTVSSPLFAKKLYVILGIPQEAALAQVNVFFIRTLFILGIVGILSLAMAWFGGDAFILRRLNLLMNTARRLGADDTTVRTRESMTYGEDELSQLSRTFDQMADSLEQREAYLRHANRELSLAYDATMEGWVRLLDLRDKETEGHTQRVTEMTFQLARVMGISEAEIIHIRRGALLHDVGKIGIPDSILLKPDRLTDDEWQIMHRHPVLVYEMLSPIAYLRPALDIPYCHHEKWDGTGYPHGLRGEQIPLAARIFAVVDVWDALRIDRPYRKGWSEDKVLEYIREHAGKHFDPQVVEAFLRLIDKLHVLDR